MTMLNRLANYATVSIMERIPGMSTAHTNVRKWVAFSIASLLVVGMLTAITAGLVHPAFADDGGGGGNSGGGAPFLH